MDIPDSFVEEVDTLLLTHRHTFNQAMCLFREQDMFDMMNTLMTHSMNLENGFETKHVFILLVLGTALVNKGYNKEQIKQCQLKMLKTYGLKKERHSMYLTFFQKMIESILSEIFALLF